MAITRTGTADTYDSGEQIYATGSQSVSIPADAEISIVCLSTYNNQGYPYLPDTPFTLGGVTVTKIQRNEINSGAGVSTWMGYALTSDTGTGTKTLAWDWTGTYECWARIACVYYKGINTASPIKDSEAQATVNADITGMTYATGDMMIGVAGYYRATPDVNDNSQTVVWASTASGSSITGGVAEKESTGDFYYSSGDYATCIAAVLTMAAAGGNVMLLLLENTLGGDANRMTGMEQ